MRTGLLLLVVVAAVFPPRVNAQQADLILAAGRVWTADTALPRAEAVAIAGNRIVLVGSRADVMALRGPGTRVIDVPAGFVSPGFIDNHTHFNSAGALLLGVNLLDVADDATLLARVREARDRLPGHEARPVATTRLPAPRRSIRIARSSIP